MNASDRFNAIQEQARETDTYWVEKAIIECTEEMVARMEDAGLNRSELARRLGKKPAFVTKLLRGNNNFTFETAVKIARALDTEFVPHLRPKGWKTQWMDYSPPKPEESPIPLNLKKQEYGQDVSAVATGDENETFALTA
ncbi:helix-turn-helix transcriptional regulator [Pontiella agarivorans]|uniref:Helix-turn-helix transcriptional regulator n=1 Tax=Pontiella agarivorans TaxID=3038953 RepID=A0ABU5MVF2_9BACT|nr:helix-turn-helix transcriptional regulator [Pontiella agarivorans]MDZ8118184.1 helix-turn-helix transcriptional regulator [Pontiella agarivorans]